MSPIAPIVLYVEDEDTDALLMRVACNKEGFGDSLHVVKDGLAAIDYLDGQGPFAERQREPLLPDLVLLDLTLPGLHGFEVLRWIRAHPDHQHVPVVVLSSSMLEADKAKAFALGANDFIPKPNSPDALQQLVKSVFGHYSTRSSNSKPRLEPAASPGSAIAQNAA